MPATLGESAANTGLVHPPTIAGLLLRYSSRIAPVLPVVVVAISGKVRALRRATGALFDERARLPALAATAWRLLQDDPARARALAQQAIAKARAPELLGEKALANAASAMPR